jgi:MFS family permease
MTFPPRPVFAVSLAAAATLLGDSLLYAVLPTIWQRLGLELWMVGVLLSANRFVRLLTNPIAGRVVERFGVRVPFVVAVFASVVTTAAYGLVVGFALLLAARLAWGLCWSFLRLGGFLVALESAGPTQRGYFLGFYNGVARLGTLVAVLFGGVMTDQLGFANTTAIFAGLTLLAALVISRERLDPVQGSPAAPPPAPQLDAPRPAIWPLGFAALMNGTTGSILVVATLGLLLVERFGETIRLEQIVIGAASLNGGLLGLRFLLDLVWAPAAGHLSDRMGRAGVVIAASGLAAAGLVGLSMPGGLAWTAATALAVFVASTALRATLDAIAGDLSAPSQPSRAVSRYANWSDLGAAIGPLAAYQLIGPLGLPAVYQIGAIGMVLTAGLALAALRGLPGASKPLPR